MSTTKPIPLAEATRDQLYAFATIVLGLDVAPTSNGPTLRAKIAAAYEGDTIVPLAPPSAPGGTRTIDPSVVHAARHPEAEASTSRYKRWVTITIAKTDDPGGTEPVPVSVNGSLMYVPRGESVKIPYPYYEVLTHAVKTSYAKSTDPFTALGPATEVLRFPMMVQHIDPDPEREAA